jgi:hypothetical protein
MNKTIEERAKEISRECFLDNCTVADGGEYILDKETALEQIAAAYIRGLSEREEWKRVEDGELPEVGVNYLLCEDGDPITGYVFKFSPVGHVGNSTAFFQSNKGAYQIPLSEVSHFRTFPKPPTP